MVVSVLHELNGYEKHLLLLRGPDTLRQQVPADCRVTMLDFNSYFSLPSAIRKVRRYIRDEKIEIVHSHLFWSNIIARLAAPSSVKVFNTIHAISSKASYEVNKLTLYLEKLTYRKRHFIIGVSGEVLKDFDKWVNIKGGSAVLYNIIDDKFFNLEPPALASAGTIKLIAVGNLRWQKNYSYLLEAFKNTPDNIHLDIYGEGDLRSDFQKEIDKHKLNIKLCGHAENMENVYPRYDAFVMCSLYEGLPLALMEAMSSGLPAFVSDVPVLREAGGEACQYFNLDDSMDFVRLMAMVSEGKIKLREMSVKSRERGKILADKKKYIKEISDLYESI